MIRVMLVDRVLCWGTAFMKLSDGADCLVTPSVFLAHLLGVRGCRTQNKPSTRNTEV